jgi:L-fucose isomerase-like protein
MGSRPGAEKEHATEPLARSGQRAEPITLGVIVGNRGFFPDHLCESGRRTILELMEKEGIRAVVTPAEATNNGAIESLAEARRCADLFREHRDEVAGVLVTLPNFGDERAVANTLRWAELNVPVLVHAFQDTTADMSLSNRRDSFCGKMSVCSNLRQYGIKFSLTSKHTMDPESDAFLRDLREFAATCRVVRSLRHLRLGQIGARPAAFNTVRYSEKLLEQAGISVETLDLSELLGWIRRLGDDEAPVTEKIEEMRAYTRVDGIPQESLLKMAKLGVCIDRFMADRGLSATAIQCWTSLEEFYGVVPCTAMSMMSDRLMASACEADIAGTLSMYVLQEAARVPAALLDWNNNFGDDPNKGVVFHCSNLPKAFFFESGEGAHRMDFQEIIAGSVGKENTYGTIVGRVAPGPFTYARVTTDDLEGRIRAYVGEGTFTDDALVTFGGYGVFHVEDMQRLLRHICENGFEHHVAATRARVARVVDEALSTYMGWDVYRHA